MIEFSDAELNMILTVLSKVDPVEVVQDIQAVRRKIIAYAQEKQQAQMAEAAGEQA